jgi:hypothetical protein
MKDGTIIAFSSRFGIKHFLYYPFRYLIQLFTGSRIEHLGIVSFGDLYEARTPQVIKSNALERVKNTADHIKVFKYEPNFNLNDSQKVALYRDLQAQLGKKYGIIDAAFSAIDRLPLFRLFLSKDKAISEKQFCSKLCAIAYQKLGLISNRINSSRLHPKEFITIINENNLTGGRVSVK